MADTATLEQMQQSLAAYRAQRGGGNAAVVPPAPAPAPTGETGPAPAPENSGIGDALATYRKQRDSGTLAPSVPKDNPSALAEFAKSIFSAPATIVARPFQAAAELAGASADTVDTATKKIPIVGGLVAPVPRNFGDVKKDVGRAAETVALGTGAPIAGGALFGAGASLEQGNDLLSAQTAIDAALGAGGGKVLDWVGKPLLNAAGKVVGTITPKVIKDVAAGGADAIAKFAATHDLPLGISKVSAPVAEKVASGLQAVDEKIGSAFRKGGQAVKEVAANQFPDLNPTEHYAKVNERDIIRPTTVNEPKYAKATNIFSDAKAKGIDLGKVASDNGIIHDKIAEGKNYNTADTVDSLREQNYKASDMLARPAIKAAEPGVPRVPVSQVRGAMLKKIHDIPASQIDAADRETIIKQINQRYGENSAAARAHPDGYALSDLHDARIIAAKNGGYKPGATASDALSAQRSREEGRVFSDLFDRTAPDELGIKPFRKELEKNFLLADYLESLHGKRIPEGITKKAVRIFGRGLGGALGSKVGGFPGFLVGSRFGDILFGGFETLPNPIKIRVLESIQKTDPKAFQALRQYIGDKELERLLRKALPAPGQSSFRETPPTLFATPGGTVTPDRGAAVDLTAVEQGRAKTPTTNRRLKSYLTKAAEAQDTSRVPYIPPKDLPVINAGRKPKAARKMNDIYLK